MTLLKTNSLGEQLKLLKNNYFKLKLFLKNWAIIQILILFPNKSIQNLLCTSSYREQYCEGLRGKALEKERPRFKY